MENRIIRRIGQAIARWLTYEPTPPDDAVLLLNFDRLCYEIRPGDVILVEGRSRVSNVIKQITQSPWTHSALYIGRLYDIEEPALRARVEAHIDVAPETQLILESLLDEGTVIHPLSKYRREHLRICRPSGLSPEDARKVIAYTLERLGTGYDMRQLFDLARFLFPYGIIPRRWRSSLFRHNAGDPTRTVCSTLLAEAFQSVRFPLLPFAERIDGERIHLHQRNPRLVSPRDFDYSPYFDIIKYPLFGRDDVAIYRHLPWQDTDVVCNDLNDCFRAVAAEAGDPPKPTRRAPRVNLLQTMPPQGDRA